MIKISEESMMKKKTRFSKKSVPHLSFFHKLLNERSNNIM